MLEEVFQDHIYTLYPDFIPQEASVVVDAGAQIGDYTLLCAKFYGARVVYSFEPLPINANVMLENIRLNKLENVKFFNCALGNKSGQIEMTYTGSMVNRFSGDKHVIAQMKRLDDVLIEKPDLLKIDVEGFEMEVLKGASKIIEKNHPKIIIETHSEELKDEVIDNLGNYGYNVIHEGRKVFLERNGMGTVQNLFLY